MRLSYSSVAGFLLVLGSVPLQAQFLPLAQEQSPVIAESQPTTDFNGNAQHSPPETPATTFTPPAPPQQIFNTNQVMGHDAHTRASQSQQGHGHVIHSRSGGNTYGPTPLYKVGILQDRIFGANADQSKIKISGWADADYTFRSSGAGRTNIAPLMNNYGNEFLFREVGVVLQRPLDPKEFSWGFNTIFFGGSDAAFINPTRGWIANPDPRFSAQFTDLNVTMHLPILTEGGVDIKAGRQTSILGPMGALSWQRPFASSDMGWNIMEEGRYTGFSAVWHITKQLHWYNGLELGGWQVFFDSIASYTNNYITNVTYWLDEDARNTKVWATLLTGPTSPFNTGTTTIVELGGLHHWNDRFWQVVTFQAANSYAPIGGDTPPPPDYHQQSHTLYTYLGYHINPLWDLNGRIEWFRDLDGLRYPGGYGIPDTNYVEMTVGPNYHPYKWLQYRPEIRYDHASNPAYGASQTQRDQLSLVASVLLQF